MFIIRDHHSDIGIYRIELDKYKRLKDRSYKRNVL